MGILDGGWTPNISTPEESSRFHLQIGNQYGRNFLEQYSKAQDLEEKRREFDLETPLRQAQASSMMANVDLAKARLDGVTLDNEAARAKMEADLQFKAGAAEALQFEASLNGDYSPSKQVEMYQFFGKRPGLAYGPDGKPTAFFANLESKFKNAASLEEKARNEAEKQKLIQERTTRIAEIQAEARRAQEQLKSDNKTEMDKLKSETSLDSRRDRFMSDLMEKSGATPEEAAYKWKVSQEASNAPVIEGRDEASAINAASEWADIKENRNKKVLISYQAPSADGKTMEQKTRLITPEPMSLRKAAEAKKAADAAKKAADIKALKDAREKAKAEREAQINSTAFPKGLRIGY